ncbi:hypothetical protein QQF64_002635 [Cirrhinus molitorella]|uniref:Uncharacterized protein n=1 Tax=Cirrhinus molitorella TaxID=172907 RepID=A0ABR3MQS2_9TELE
MRSDKLESMVAENTSHITGLKEKLNSICEDVNEMKTKVSQIESSLLNESNRICILESRITELEGYSRHWNLKLHSVPESIDEKNVRKEMICSCQKLLPEHSDRLLDVIDTVHRVGMKKVNSNHGIIIQFSSRTLRAAVWVAAKSSAYQREKGLCFREDLCKADREMSLCSEAGVWTQGREDSQRRIQGKQDHPGDREQYPKSPDQIGNKPDPSVVKTREDSIADSQQSLLRGRSQTDSELVQRSWSVDTGTRGQPAKNPRSPGKQDHPGDREQYPKSPDQIRNKPGKKCSNAEQEHTEKLRI